MMVAMNHKIDFVKAYSLVRTVAFADISFIMLRMIQKASPNANSFLYQIW